VKKLKLLGGLADGGPPSPRSRRTRSTAAPCRATTSTAGPTAIPPGRRGSASARGTAPRSLPVPAAFPPPTRAS